MGSTRVSCSYFRKRSVNQRGSKTSSNYRKIALRPLWAAMAGSPAPPTAGPRWSSGRSRWPRAASCCLPAGCGVRRCHASPRWHRCGRCFNLAGALVDDLEVDGGARRGNGPSSRPQIGSVRQPRWLTTSFVSNQGARPRETQTGRYGLRDPAHRTPIYRLLVGEDNLDKVEGGKKVATSAGLEGLSNPPIPDLRGRW